MSITPLRQRLKMPPSLAKAGIALCALSLSACMTVTLEGFGEKTPNAERGTETTHGSLYGFFWSAPTVEKCTDSAQLYRVRFHTNIGYLTTSLITLGLYVPQTTEWWCSAAQAHDPEEETLYRPDAFN